MRLFHVFSTGDLTLNSLSVTNWITRGSMVRRRSTPGQKVRGGAIYNEGGLHIVASTLYANQVIGGNGGGSAGGGGWGRGGVIYNDGGTLTITDSTFSGNIAKAARGCRRRVALAGRFTTKMDLSAFTAARLQTVLRPPGEDCTCWLKMVNGDRRHLDLIIAQGDAAPQARDFPACAGSKRTDNCDGRQQFDSFRATTRRLRYRPTIRCWIVLANNGGPTMTHALLAGSPAINLGSNTKSLGLTSEAHCIRGVVGGVADIGSFEMQSVTGPALLGDYNGNHVVDAADYVLWRRTVGNTVSRPFVGADGDGSGTVDSPDYGVWRSHFGMSVGAGSSSIATAASIESTAPVRPAVLSNTRSKLSLLPRIRPPIFTRAGRAPETRALWPCLNCVTRSPRIAQEITSGFAAPHVAKPSAASGCELETLDAVWSAWATAV